jgi:uncharacterized small protein (DUF1192 family)
MSSYDLETASFLGSGEMAKEYVRMRKQWSHEFSMEFIRVYRKISRLQEEIERLNREVERVKAQTQASVGGEH